MFLGHLTQLRSLNLASTTVSTGKCKSQRSPSSSAPFPHSQVSSLPPLPQLRVLNLNNCPITTEGLVQTLVATPHLHTLYIANTKVLLGQHMADELRLTYKRSLSKVDTFLLGALRHASRLHTLSIADCDRLRTRSENVGA